MTQEKKQWISDVASTILDESKQENALTDIRKVAKDNGLSIQIGTFNDKQIVCHYSRSEKKIQVSQEMNYAKTSFAIAHQLAHHIMHTEKESETYNLLDSYMQDKSEKEQEANWFASCLLMPESKLKLFGRNHSKSILCNLFGVNPMTVGLRLDYA